MDGVKALVVLASIYYPGDGIRSPGTDDATDLPLGFCSLHSCHR